jgi:hypothetical protein
MRVALKEIYELEKSEAEKKLGQTRIPFLVAENANTNLPPIGFCNELLIGS